MVCKNVKLLTTFLKVLNEKNRNKHCGVLNFPLGTIKIFLGIEKIKGLSTKPEVFI